jgi:hypothetical protein
VGSTAAGLAVIVGAAGILIGWNARSARGAHGDLKVYKTRIPAFRRVRNRAGLRSLVLVVITLLALSAMFRA